MALGVAKALDVVEIFENARQHYGTPASVLTDNGAIFTAKYRGGKAALEIELERLGVICKHSSPYHPQTCGKVERFHQTMKKYLAKQRAPARSLSCSARSTPSSPITTSAVRTGASGERSPRRSMTPRSKPIPPHRRRATCASATTRSTPAAS